MLEVATPGKIVWNGRLRCTLRLTLPTLLLMASQKKYQIDVTTRTTYIPEQSDPDSGRYVFAYTITIRNTGSVTAQLISRHWIITDANNRVQEVRGLGVVGEQPLLKADESFEYTSGTAIATPVGTMRGSYQMVAEDGLQFDAPVPEFTLSMPRVLH
jgi:ApaG protein